MIRKECGGCEDWRPVGRFCSRIASDMPCVHGQVRYVGPAPNSSDVKWTKAGDTQVAGDHYKKMKIQPVEYIHANGIGFSEGNVIKYVSRWRSKGGIGDLKKARHTLDLLIELEEKAIKASDPEAKP